MKPIPIRSAWTVRALAVLAIAGATVLASETPSVSPADLVRQTVDNELKHSGDGPKFMFRDTKETPRGSSTKLMVETRDAMAGMLIAINGKPLAPGIRQAELSRLDHLAQDREALQRKRKQEKDDEARVNRIVKALPDAFIFEPDGTQLGVPGMGKLGNELVRLKFRPNPKYDPPTRTEQVLTGMQGYVLIDANKDRIAKIDGTLFKDVTFGWGILGHLDKGGHFLVEQADVGGDHWEISHMSLDFTGKILLFKGISIKSDEAFSDFHPAPPDLTFAQGVELLKKQESALAENQANEQNQDPK
ncbi:MAG: hypothetical protein LAN63_09410 [Acidobacteriia bacterium]|nr:hypothetical protein [Terriglobia bacterium]